jgi:hypothetical protein
VSEIRYARGDDPYANSPDRGDDSACNCGGAWHARFQHCVDWPCPGCDRLCAPGAVPVDFEAPAVLDDDQEEADAW